MTTPKDITDLLASVARRDRAAFERLYEATSAKLFGVTLRILNRRDLAEEVLQEVFVKIWERAGEFNPKLASPITWMCAIARNRALDEIRRKRPDSIEDHPEFLDIASGDELALDAILRGETGQQLVECLAQLEPDRAKMVVLAYCEGLSREELGERYNQPVNTIKTWLRRSLLQLRTCLGS
ncbi:MAG: sigma-70 family RNA polymerase sigma factor [Hyphomicrobium sp.]